MQKNRTLRVGYLAPGWPLSSYPNGIIAYLENLLTGFSDKVEPVILTTNLNEPEKEGFTVDARKYDNYRDLPREILIKLLYLLKLKNAEAMQYEHFLRSSAHLYKSIFENLREPLDIVEAEESLGGAYYAINKSKTKFITRLHGPWFTMQKIFNLESNNQFKIRVFYEGEVIRNSNGLTAPSLDVLEKVRAYYNLELPQAKVIPNPVLPVSQEKQWKLAEVNSYILFVGRFDSHKGGDLIIDSFNIVAQKDKNISLNLVGPDRGVIVEGAQLNIQDYILRNVRDESIRNRIKFHGHCSSDEIAIMRQKARVTVLCSRYENHSLSLLESLAVGCPTVATAVGGNKEIIIDDYNGLLAEAESPESIAEKVLVLLNDHHKSELLSKNAIEDSLSRFSPIKIAEQSLEYYKSVLSQ